MIFLLPFPAPTLPLHSSNPTLPYHIPMSTEIKALLMARVNDVADVDESTMAQLEQHAARLEHSGRW